MEIIQKNEIQRYRRLIESRLGSTLSIAHVSETMFVFYLRRVPQANVIETFVVSFEEFFRQKLKERQRRRKEINEWVSERNVFFSCSRSFVLFSSRFIYKNHHLLSNWTRRKRNEKNVFKTLQKTQARSENEEKTQETEREREGERKFNLQFLFVPFLNEVFSVAFLLLHHHLSNSFLRKDFFKNFFKTFCGLHACVGGCDR